MKYLFEELEVLTETILASPGHHHFDPEVCEKFNHEIRSIKSKLKEIYFKHWSDLDFQKFTKIHHEALIALLQKVLENSDFKSDTIVLNEEECNYTPKDASRTSVYDALKNLLRFIHKHFEKHIPKDQMIPQLLRKPLIIEVKGLRKSIVGVLADHPDEQIVFLIQKPFHDFVHKPIKCTWHNLFYCRVLRAELVQLADLRDHLTTGDFISLLYDLNYNSNQFYRYLVDYINRTSGDNYLEHIYSMRKEMRQNNIKANVIYKPNNSTLLHMLEKWFEEELHFLERTRQLSFHLGPDVAPSHNDELHNKILVNLSVNEFAYLLKLLTEANILKIENHKQFFNTISKGFRTKGTETISPESLRTKFYNPDDKSITAIKDRLIKMLNRINSLS